MRFFVSMIAVALVACSSSAVKQEDPIKGNDVPGDVKPGDDVDSGVVVADGTDASVSVDASHTRTQDECIAGCETQYPKAAALNKQLDANCFLGGACAKDCNDLAPNGKLSGVTNDAAVVCAIGDGVDPIMTPSAACSDCIAAVPACCGLWVSIFGSVDGRALNKCAVACYSK